MRRATQFLIAHSRLGRNSRFRNPRGCSLPLQIYYGGFIGVDIFFVLSGYLITSILLREWMVTNNICLANFYWRRAVRLGPALLMLVAVACFYETLYLAWPSVDNVFVRSFYTLSYFGNWPWALRPTENPMGAFGATWSLAIEEQFYFIWPITLLQLLKLRLVRFHLSGLLLGGIAVAILWRYFLWRSGAHTFRIYAGTDTHADPILIGCFLAIAVGGLSKSTLSVAGRWIAATAPFCMTGLVAMALFSNVYAAGVFQITTVAILTSLLILTVTVAPSKIALVIFEFPALTWLGRVSYGLYLWHSVGTMYLIEHNLVQSRLGWIAIGLGLASLSYYLVEKPCLCRLGWKDKYSTTGISDFDAKSSFLHSTYIVDSEHHGHAPQSPKSEYDQTT